MELKKLLSLTIERSASDLHIISSYEPTIRVNGELIILKIASKIDETTTEKILLPILNDDQKGRLQTDRELDFGYDFQNHRFRVNMYFTKGSLAASFRLIPQDIQTI